MLFINYYLFLKYYKDRRLLILATTNFGQSELRNLNMSDCFNSEIYVPSIDNLLSVDHVLKELKLFNDDERNKALSDLKEVELNIGVKKLLMIIEMCRQDVDDRVKKFVETIKSVNVTRNLAIGRNFINIDENENLDNISIEIPPKYN
jgi:vesicle-fusing ATPase